jgi:type I restriction enzyme R subunit
MPSLTLRNKNEDVLMSTAGGLARMDREIDAKKEKEIEMVSGGKPFKQWITRLLGAFDPDKRIDLAKP